MDGLMGLIGHSKALRQKLDDYYPKRGEFRLIKHAVKQIEERIWRQDMEDEFNSVRQEIEDIEQHLAE